MVQQAILKREIAWPKPGSGKKMLEANERDLIDKMLTLDPAERLGGTPETMGKLKEHPLFKGIDWTEISQPEFDGCGKLIAELEKAEKEFVSKQAAIIIP